MEDDLIYLKRKLHFYILLIFHSILFLRTLTVLYPLIKYFQCILFVFCRFGGTLRLCFLLPRSKKGIEETKSWNPSLPLCQICEERFDTFICSSGPCCSICQLKLFDLFITLLQIILNFKPRVCKVLSAFCSGVMGLPIQTVSHSNQKGGSNQYPMNYISFIPT